MQLHQIREQLAERSTTRQSSLHTIKISSGRTGGG
jgi:hypothetical protein